MTRLRATFATMRFALDNLVAWHRRGGLAMWHAADVELDDMGRLDELWSTP